jgi:hypothetical protein
MPFLLLGVASLVLLMLALGAFSRAQVKTIKQFGVWFVAIGGLVLVTLLLLTGKGVPALAALGMLGPLVWRWLRESGAVPTATGRAGPRSTPTRGGAMSRAEAYSVLGLAPGADAEAIRAAHRRLMRAAHPDAGGSDWLATRINQARDVLLG